MSFLVTKEAIDFTAKSVLPDGSIQDKFNLREYAEGKYAVLFFYPLDFTFVCPTEIIAFSNRIGSFYERNAVVIGVSVDSHFCHVAWRNTPIKSGGIGNVTYPLVSDLSKSISRDYGVLVEDSVSLRGTFVIDKNFIIRYAGVNDLPIGRNIDEILRIIDAAQHNDEYGEVCPAGWYKDKDAIQPNHESIADYLASHKDEL
jgi:peroxiredoxin (alkyl hydroperoxide reductase subunit C)